MTNPSNNPLLGKSTLPNGAPPLDSVLPEHFLPALQAGIAEAREAVAAIKANPAAPTFENTIEALEFSGAEMGRVSSIFHNIIGANGNDALREVENDMDMASIQYGNEVSMDPVLFERIKKVYDSRASLKLTAEQQLLLEETYKGFVRSGALLNDNEKEEYKKLSEKLTELTTLYRNNALKSTAAFKKVIDDEAQLAGVPERAKKFYAHMAEEAGLPGKFLIKLSPPPLDILTHAEDRALREEINRAMSSVAYKGEFDNSQVALDIVKTRQAMAQLKGYDTHAAYVLDNRMAKTPEAVVDFLKKNEKIYRPAAESYLQKVKDYAEKTDGLKDLKPWDVAYYGRKLKEETFNLDLETLRPYFNLEKVLEGMRIHAEKLFNIEMKETKDKYPVYHPDVKVYEVFDKKDGSLIGVFYGDYYARPGAKRSGAWMSNFRERGITDGENQCAIVTNVCNFPKPTKDQPTLLSMDEVTTVFHEFGHGLHALLAKGNYTSLTGTNVKWDFVELPSQLQENWAKLKEVLDTFAKHYKTGESLTAELIDKMNEMDNFAAGYVGLRQTFLGLLDMAYHGVDANKLSSIEAVEDKLIAETWLFPRVEGASMSANFGHIFSGGYSSGYYSYKWAEVLEADVFETFLKNGIYDRETGDRLRNTIYSQGGTKDPMDLFIEMMGRKPDADALFRREGLIGNDNAKPAPKPAAGHKPPGA